MFPQSMSLMFKVPNLRSETLVASLHSPMFVTASSILSSLLLSTTVYRSSKRFPFHIALVSSVSVRRNTPVTCPSSTCSQWNKWKVVIMYCGSAYQCHTHTAVCMQDTAVDSVAPFTWKRFCDVFVSSKHRFRFRCVYMETFLCLCGTFR